MAEMLVDSTKLDACLDAEADAIRAKTGGSADIPFDFTNNKGFADAIAAIPSGGGSGDYELVDTYTVTEPVTQLSMTIPEWASSVIIIFNTQDSASNKPALYHTSVAVSRLLANANTAATHDGRFTVVWVSPDSNNFGFDGTAGWFLIGSLSGSGAGVTVNYGKPSNVLYAAGSSATFTGNFTLYARR